MKPNTTNDRLVEIYNAFYPDAKVTKEELYEGHVGNLSVIAGLKRIEQLISRREQQIIASFKAKMPKEEEEGFLESYGWTKGYNQALKEINKILDSLS